MLPEIIENKNRVLNEARQALGKLRSELFTLDGIDMGTDLFAELVDIRTDLATLTRRLDRFHHDVTTRMEEQ
jgi:hypothetical protein